MLHLPDRVEIRQNGFFMVELSVEMFELEMRSENLRSNLSIIRQSETIFQFWERGGNYFEVTSKI